MLKIVGATQLRRKMEGECTLIIDGGISVAFGILLAILPAPANLLSLLWLIGYAVAVGIVRVVLAFRV